MTTDDEEMNRAVADWDSYRSTPYAPYRSLPDYIGWTVEEYNHWLKTGEKPRNWEWD
jgi:hypothetical protein